MRNKGDLWQKLANFVRDVFTQQEGNSDKGGGTLSLYSIDSSSRDVPEPWHLGLVAKHFRREYNAWTAMKKLLYVENLKNISQSIQN